MSIAALPSWIKPGGSAVVVSPSGLPASATIKTVGVRDIILVEHPIRFQRGDLVSGEGYLRRVRSHGHRDKAYLLAAPDDAIVQSAQREWKRRASVQQTATAVARWSNGPNDLAAIEGAIAALSAHRNTLQPTVD